MGLSHSSTGLALEQSWAPSEFSKSFLKGLGRRHKGCATLNHFVLNGSNGTQSLQSSRRRLRMQTSSWLPSSAKALTTVTA